MCSQHLWWFVRTHIVEIFKFWKAVCGPLRFKRATARTNSTGVEIGIAIQFASSLSGRRDICTELGARDEEKDPERNMNEFFCVDSVFESGNRISTPGSRMTARLLAEISVLFLLRFLDSASFNKGREAHRDKRVQ